ncbi:MAG: ACP S-malonyltransferase [Candidatus Aminicenantes bacterium]|nr:MAG: ACP S-malonyltransferase [Candidatus Aminicenantes bacterium]
MDKDKLAFLFPGQGSQYGGMGAGLYKKFSEARQTFEQANEILGFDLRKICFSGGLVELNKAENLFPALVTFGVAVFRVYMKEIGIIPHFSAGHSLGEYSALVCSGVISFPDALKIVHKRGILAREVLDNKSGSMTIINGVDAKIVEGQCREVSNREQWAAVSCYNSSDQVAVSGHPEVVMKVEDCLIKRKAQVTPLLMSPPFHCPLMQEAADQFKSELTAYSYHPGKWPVIANVTALPYSAPDDVVDHLLHQLTRPVKWKQTMDYLQQQGVELMIEMGPQAVLTNLVKTNEKTKHLSAVSFGQTDDRNAMLHRFHTRGTLIESLSMPSAAAFISRCLAAAVCTPNFCLDRHRYQAGVIEPYEKIEKIQDQLDKTGALPTVEQMDQALEMLRSVFNTKKVSIEQQLKRFNHIFAETRTRNLFPDFKMPTNVR